tara:strand:+ start:357 stop:1253 length:897 start_codon:yes stop_codon:yes gene_type:complete
MALMWKYRRGLLRDRDLKLDRFTAPGIPGISLLNALRIPTPKFSFDLSGMKGVGTALGIVGVAFVVAFTFVVASTDDTPVWPEAGAAYPLPNVHGISLEPDPENPADQNQTLQINLASGVRLTNLTLNNLDLGKAGLTDCVVIQRTTNTTGWLYVDNWVMTGVSAPSLDFANVETGNLVLQAYTDGHAMDATIDSTITEININSSRGSGEFTAQNSVVDRVIIEMHGDAIIGTLTMTDVDCSVGGFNVDYVKAGSISMDATSKFGDGDGINTADYTINSTVKARTITDNLVDTPITVK